jgi:cytochrome c551/c552
MPATEQIWRPLPTMHRIFAWSAVALLAATFLMMARDEARDWRKYQSTADELRIEQLREQLAPYNTPEFKQAEAEKVAAVDAAKKKLETPEVQKQIAELERRRRELQSQVDLVSRQTKFKNAERDVARANFDLNVRDNKPTNVLTSQLDEFDAQAKLSMENNLKLQGIQAELRSVKDKLTEVYAERTAAETELTKFRGDRTRLQELLYKVSPNDEALPEDMRNSFAAAKRSMKEWPILNGFNPHHAIQYDWPKDLEIQLGMAKVSRVDRCRSCHVNINDFGAGNIASFPKDKYHEPFTSHPNPELFLTSTSPHPIEKFGCTVCHDGDGSGTSFQAAEHTPRDPAQAKEWEEKYGWHSNHFWEYPMQQSQFVESSCLKCHHNVVELGVNAKHGATAPKVFAGYELIKNYGCFGCHEINGYDGTRPIGPDMRLEPNSAEELAAIEADPNSPPPGNLRKVGPSLRHVGSKVTENFISYWTEDPQRFRPSTKMPKFFHLDNQQDNLAAALQPVELAAIEAYLNSKSEPLELMAPAEGYQPDAERGKIAFMRRGCMACHSRDEEEFKGVNPDFGPNITNIHEKLKPGPEGFRWLYTWLKNPELHHPRTRMPNLYLNPETVNGQTVDPAADIAAFLIKGAPKEFPAQQVGGPSLGLVFDQNFTKKTADSLRAQHKGVRVVEVLQTGAGSRALSLDVNGKPPINRAGAVKSDFERLAPVRRDDIVLEFNGQAVTSPQQLEDLARAAGLGKRVTLKLFSDGLERLVEVRVSTPLEDLTRLYLSKSLPDMAEVDRALEARRYAYKVPEYAYQPKSDGSTWNFREWVKGDEIELVARAADEQIDDATWQKRQMEYIGRRTISRYGCYACHDIPGFEDAKPIGTALQDWGRKDTSKLAPEHIMEFLHHHGEPDGSSTHERIAKIVKRAVHDNDVPDSDRSAASFYQSLEHHGRPGFIWQKLRAPRSYDYRKTESKGWDERLKMPKFPINEQEIDVRTWPGERSAGSSLSVPSHGPRTGPD